MNLSWLTYWHVGVYYIYVLLCLLMAIKVAFMSLNFCAWTLAYKLQDLVFN